MDFRMDLKNKKLLVLGGFAQHIEIIQEAKKRGAYVIVIDYLKDSPGKKIADEDFLISIVDVDQIVELCKEKNIDGIMNYCIDPGQKPYQQVCEKLGYKCYGTKDQFEILTNKDLFYETCIKHNIDVIPRYDLDYFDIENEIDKIEYPIVVKPVDSRASKGITVCWGKKDIKPAIKYALDNSIRKKLIFEKYMDKDEVCAKYFVANGEIFLSSFSDTYSYHKDGQKVSINGKFFPSKHYNQFKENADVKIRNMIKSIGIKDGPLSFTAFYDDGKFRFFDPSFRLGGAQQWRIEAHATGVDKSTCMTNFALLGSMGDTSQISKIENGFDNKFGAMVFFLLKLGKIDKIVGLNEALKQSSVIGYCQSHYEGDIVHQWGTTDQVAFWIHLVSSSKEKLISDIKIIQNLIRINDKDGNNMLLPNFNTDLL